MELSADNMHRMNSGEPVTVILTGESKFTGRVASVSIEDHSVEYTTIYPMHQKAINRPRDLQGYADVVNEKTGEKWAHVPFDNIEFERPAISPKIDKQLKKLKNL